MKWLVLICFAIFMIGVFGFLINIFKGKSPWSTQEKELPLEPYETEDGDMAIPDDNDKSASSNV